MKLQDKPACPANSYIYGTYVCHLYEQLYVVLSILATFFNSKSTYFIIDGNGFVENRQLLITESLQLVRIHSFHAYLLISHGTGK